MSRQRVPLLMPDTEPKWGRVVTFDCPKHGTVSVRVRSRSVVGFGPAEMDGYDRLVEAHEDCQ